MIGHHRVGSPAVLTNAVARPVASMTGPTVTDVGQLPQFIALGRAVGLLPASVLIPTRPDVVRVPVEDAPPVTLLLAWPQHSRDPAIAAFVRAAGTVINQSR